MQYKPMCEGYATTKCEDLEHFLLKKFVYYDELA